ncbi:glycoside hydrolase [Piromyces finnis]|uniref:Glycoside hydrolase n=1 Tax=Piromyces finnis TaxID=1754191 RepID=A0A1Y1VJT8_9FUNG|nr:glycoside hydrolase [Piromyces finnis]|eukprot:ORX57944.1 glycoside hydrolase [Piromyces finnis]
MKILNCLWVAGYIGTTFAITTNHLIKEMGLGWNLGNTLESYGTWINGVTTKDYETAWGNPVTTEVMIKTIKSYGFKSVRIPVSWSNLMSSDYIISPQLLKRVEEVVNYVINNDMYAIMNIHYDGGWFDNFATSEKEAFNKYEKIWQQLTEYFVEYDEHLIFESLNEEGCWDSIWNRYSNSGNKTKAYNLLNTINQDFVNIVRDSGGNNTKRHLLLAGYCTDIDLTVDSAYIVPKDDRVMVSVHYYTPSTFTLLEKEESWGKPIFSWGTTSDVENLKNDFNKLKTRFVNNGIPVIIGEYGVTAENKDKNSIHKYLSTVVQYAKELGICPIVWDHGQYFNRSTLTFKDSEIGTMYKNLSSNINSNITNDSNDNKSEIITTNNTTTTTTKSEATNSNDTPVTSNNNNNNNTPVYCQGCTVTGTGGDQSLWGWENNTACRINESICGTTNNVSNNNCVDLWYQCGGINYNGSTKCCTGKCQYINDWYSMCQM